MALRDEWPEGQRFRVVREGGQLDGLAPDPQFPSAWRGWQRDLHVGDVIVCRGYGPGWGSDPGYGVHFMVEGAEHVSAIEFRPHQGGVFDYRPADGFLEPVE